MKKAALLILVALVAGLAVYIKISSSCYLSDAEAISIAKDFSSKLNTPFIFEPVVRNADHSWWLNSEPRVKEVTFNRRESSELEFKINCATKQVVAYYNWKIRRQVREKYNISNVTTEHHNWPGFLSKVKAKEILISISNKLEIPTSLYFNDLSLDKDNGFWSGWWVRKYKGYSFESDGAGISIAAVDGEIVSYGLSLVGEPCPTEVKISKEQAIEESLMHASALFKAATWAKYKDQFDVVSAELKIVQPTIFHSWSFPWYSTSSRLAWKVVFQLRSLKWTPLSRQ